MDPRRVPSYASFTIRRVSYSFQRVQPTEQHDIRDGSSGVFSPAENVPSYRTPAFQPTEQHGIRDGSSGVFSPAENMASYPTLASQPTEQHDIRDGSSGVFSPAENGPSNPTPVSLASTPSVDPRASASQVTLHPGSVRRKRGRPRIHPRRAVDQRTTSSPLPGPSSSLSADAPLPDQPVRRKRGRPRGRSRKALGNAGRNFMTHVLIIESGEDVVRKIMSFVEIAKNACILSATGTVNGVSLFHLDNAGGSVSYEASIPETFLSLLLAFSGI
ncbi:AT-hook motif nuclear-localized protein 3-like [Musa acuminata AAA Group]|uniref:AT-hook motif nuclear-localized protein 3-like n=1 Tax=Musa acuminata AAA Group TaxID=214697 RepID=UPI0031CFA07F